MEIKVVSDKPYKEMKVTIEPDTTAAQIIEGFGLDTNLFMLAKKDKSSFYKLEDQPFSDLRDGEKLHIVQHSEVAHNK
jgi:hypothetical protein